MKQFKIKYNDKKRGFLSMLLGTLDASLLWNILTGKEIIRAGYISKGKGIIRAGYGSRRSSKRPLIKDF